MSSPTTAPSASRTSTVNEPFFQGHFPERPVMPGVLIIESMAQTAAALVVHTLGAEAEGKLVYFMTVDEGRFRRPVSPGDTLMVHVKKERSRRNVYKFKGVARVGEAVVAEAMFSAMIMTADGRRPSDRDCRPEGEYRRGCDHRAVLRHRP